MRMNSLTRVRGALQRAAPREESAWKHRFGAVVMACWVVAVLSAGWYRDDEDEDEDESFSSPIDDMDELLFFAQSFHDLQVRRLHVRAVLAGARVAQKLEGCGTSSTELTRCQRPPAAPFPLSLHRPGESGNGGCLWHVKTW